MDRVAWPATVHEVERGGTRLSDYHTHKHGHGDGEEMGARLFVSFFSQPPGSVPASAGPWGTPGDVVRKGRENTGPIKRSGVGLRRAGPQILSYFPAGTPQPPHARVASELGTSSHAHQSCPSSLAGNHAPVPSWAEAAGRGGPPGES